MTIKQQGGIFGRNPTFNDVTVENNMTIDGTTTVDKLGVGTNSPNTQLEIVNNTNNLARVRVSTTDTTPNNYRGYEFAQGSSFKGGLLQDQSTDSISIFTPLGGQSVIVYNNGNVSLNGGNLAFNSGNGIDFSATSDAAGSSSELLSDYEHGTWTVTDLSAAGLTFTNPTGQYVRVGRFVSAFAAFTFPTTSDTNNASIGGLPYNALDDNSARATGVITYSNYASTHSLWIYGPRNSGQFLIIDSGANAKTNANLSGKTFYVQFNYQT